MQRRHSLVVDRGDVQQRLRLPDLGHTEDGKARADQVRAFAFVSRLWLSREEEELPWMSLLRIVSAKFRFRESTLILEECWRKRLIIVAKPSYDLLVLHDLLFPSLSFILLSSFSFSLFSLFTWCYERADCSVLRHPHQPLFPHVLQSYYFAQQSPICQDPFVLGKCVHLICSF